MPVCVVLFECVVELVGELVMFPRVHFIHDVRDPPHGAPENRQAGDSETAGLSIRTSKHFYTERSL